MIRIVIADDQSTIQEALKSYCELEPDLEIVGVAIDGQVAIEKVEELQPDIVIMDIEMPVVDGLTATRIISESFVETKVLILSIHDSKKYLNHALQVGAQGYLLKTTPADELVNAIRSVHKGYFQLGPGLFEESLYNIRKLESKVDPFAQEKFNKMIEHRIKELEHVLHYSEVKQLEIGKFFDFKYRELYLSLTYMKSSLDDVTKRIYKIDKKLYTIRDFLLFFGLIVAAIIVFVWILG